MNGRFPARRLLLPLAIVVALFQSGILLHVVTSRAAVLRDGAEILLKTAPVDPRDLLRGDYVVLNYDIGQVPAALVQGAWPEERARHALWVRLEAGADGFWTVREASFAVLPARQGSVVVKGVTGRFLPRASDGTVGVSYGIERYYVPEGEGHAIEAARNDGRIAIAARVSAEGVAHIRALMEDGRPLYEEPLY